MKRDFDSGAKDWDKDEGRKRLAQEVAAAMKANLALGHDLLLLDFGAGTGLVSLALLPHVRGVVAVDPSQGMLDVLRGKIETDNIPNMQTLLWDADNPAAALPRADIIVSSMTLHHVPDVDGILKRFYDALTPNGQIAVADLDSDGGQFHPDPTGVEHEGFDRDSLRNKFLKTGFHSVMTTTAATLRKPAKDGEMKDFTVFLMTARK